MTANAVIDDAARTLRAGGVVAFPTETVYGLGADARSHGAVRAVYDLKQRPARNPLIVHVTDAEHARPLARIWDPRAETLARELWPGPLTLAVPCTDELPKLVTAGGPTVGLRAPDHPVAQQLLHAFDGPIVGPSANRAGSVSPTTAQHVRNSFPDRPDLTILDGGPCATGVESTVLRIPSDPDRPARILRPGGTPTERIEDALGETVDRPPVPPTPPDPADHDHAEATDDPLESPGLLSSHYAPAARVRLARGYDVSETIDQERAASNPVVVLAHSSVAQHAARTRAGGDGALIEMPADDRAYAARLYAALREADNRLPHTIIVERPPSAGGLWDAVLDRLTRAAAPRTRS